MWVSYLLYLSVLPMELLDGPQNSKLFYHETLAETVKAVAKERNVVL